MVYLYYRAALLVLWPKKFCRHHAWTDGTHKTRRQPVVEQGTQSFFPIRRSNLTIITAAYLRFIPAKALVTLYVLPNLDPASVIEPAHTTRYSTPSLVANCI